MSVRRCISKEIVNSGSFIQMDAKSQLLYIHLLIIADDDGIVDDASVPLVRSKATKKNLNELIDKKYIIETSNGVNTVYIIKHWLMQNNIQPSKRKESNYSWVVDSLWVEDNYSYTLDGSKARWEYLAFCKSKIGREK